MRYFTRQRSGISSAGVSLQCGSKLSAFAAFFSVGFFSSAFGAASCALIGDNGKAKPRVASKASRGSLIELPPEDSVDESGGNVSSILSLCGQGRVVAKGKIPLRAVSSSSEQK